MMDYPLTLSALLRHTERSYARQEIVSRRADRSLLRYSYGECLERARRLASGLRKLGVKRGERVATFCWNHTRHLEAYYGVPSGGFVLHTLNIRLHCDELAYIASHAGDRVFILGRGQDRGITGRDDRARDLRPAGRAHGNAGESLPLSLLSGMAGR